MEQSQAEREGDRGDPGNTADEGNAASAAGRTAGSWRTALPGMAAAVGILAIGTLATGCEFLDNLGAGTGAGTGASGGAALPTVTAIVEEAKRVGRSPYEVLTRRYELKSDALTTRYRKEKDKIAAQRASGSITGKEADARTKLLELEEARDLAALLAVKTQRERELDALRELFGNTG